MRIELKTANIAHYKGFESFLEEVYGVYVSLSTQDDLSQWLRDKHNVHVSVDPIDGLDGTIMWVFSITNLDEDLLNQNNENLEEALDFATVPEQSNGSHIDYDRLKKHLNDRSGGDTFEKARENGLKKALEEI